MLIPESYYGIPADPYWPTAAGWLAGQDRELLDAPVPVMRVQGIPLSQSSPAPSSAHATPPLMRQHLNRFSSFAAGVGLREPLQIDLRRAVRCEDLGDLALADRSNLDAQALIEADARARRLDLIDDAGLSVYVGGDDAIIRPIMNGVFPDLSRVGLLTLDSHHDVRAHYRNDGRHNGSPVRGLIEDGLLGRNVVQIGMSPFGNAQAYRKFCDDHGFTVIEASWARRQGVGACVEASLAELSQRVDAILVDIDLDVIGSEYHPACFGARPGGLAPFEVYEAAFAIGAARKVTSLCLVEVEGTRDRDGIGIDTLCLTLLHAAAGLSTRAANR